MPNAIELPRDPSEYADTLRELRLLTRDLALFYRVKARRLILERFFAGRAAAYLDRDPDKETRFADFLATCADHLTAFGLGHQTLRYCVLCAIVVDTLPAGGSRSMLDALHHAAYTARTKTLDAALDGLQRHRVDTQPTFASALAAVLEVLPVSRAFTNIEEPAGAVAEAASDFEALENLRRLAFSERIGKPRQLGLWE